MSIAEVRRVGVVILSVVWAIAAGGRLAAEDALRTREERAMQAALARVAPSVVRIETVGGLERIGQVLIGTGPTTGLVVSADGHIVSSAFNFVQKPASILVTLEDGSRQAARLVATDHSRMLVLLKVETQSKLNVPEFVPKSEMHVGQWALAVGRAFDAREPNVSVGIVSALDRVWSRALQTDAKISPGNYGGALVDIRGRVLGVLVPMSPQDTGEVAGVEWYDSGIGFAIPLEDVNRTLSRLTEGKDLHPGLLGISLKGTDIFGEPAVIAQARVTGPAYKAGFRAGDKIVEVAGQSVTRAAQLKHAIGPLYAGDIVRVVAERGEARVDREVPLAEKVDPFEYPFLGILPKRFAKSDANNGLVVRYVYPDSAAAAAGMMPGDRIKSFAGKEVAGAASLVEAMLELAPGETVKMEIGRDGQTVLLDAQLGRLPESLPGELPPARDAWPAAPGERPAVGVVPIKVPEFAGECVAYVPESYHPEVAYGVVVWLHAPGGFKQEELVERWKTLCDERDLILLAPKSSDPATWHPTELRFVRRVLDEILNKYSTDPARMVVHGHEGGASMAYVVGLTNLDMFRAIAAVDGPLPRMVRPPETDPVHRLAIYTTLAAKSPTTAATQAGVERLRELKYPVTVQEIGEQGRYLTPEELAGLARWIDALDRL
jgi:serine protease Do